MGKYDFIKIKKKLSKYLDEARFEHTMGVMYTCAALAMVMIWRMHRLLVFFMTVQSAFLIKRN